MSRGGSSIFIGLVVMFITALLVIGLLRGVVAFVDPQGAERYVHVDPGSEEAHKNFGYQIGHQLYQVFNHLSDPGTMAYDIDSSPFYKATAVLAGMVGVVIFSALIAFITTALDQKISELKKGHSKVVEDGHTLILGWNERVVEILRELIIANESEDNPCVVILSKVDKEEMDDYLKIHLPDRQNTRIVTRSGAESSLVNLGIASVEHCKSVIVLANCSPSASDYDKAGSDSVVIKTILAAVASMSEESDEEEEVPIVAEVFLDRNRKIVEEISNVAVTVDTDEILAKILVQTSRSVGLSVVYGEILSFDGCEMYFHEDDWGQINFGDLAYRFPDGIPMGVRHEDGSIDINPAIDSPMQEGDAILILAEDDSTIDYLSTTVATPGDYLLAGGRQPIEIEKNLIIGWTPKVKIILREYADYVKEGSQIDIMLRAPNDTVIDEIEKLNEELEEISIQLITENPLTRDGLLAARPFQYGNIIILSQGGDEQDEERTDSETVVILLLLRQIFDENRENVGNIKLITEILDSENQPLVARTGVNDFIISNRFVSMILAQISEDADIKRVYDDLFSEEGSEIYLKPASLYFKEFPVTVSYADMIHVAQQREEVCLGVKIKKFEDSLDDNFGVKLIPEKTKEYTIGPDDTLVVLAEDET